MIFANPVPDATRPPRRVPARPEGAARLDGWAGFPRRVLRAEGPAEILEGHVFRDAARIREALARHAAPDAAGGLLGWVGFGGDFRFGVFPQFRVEQGLPEPGAVRGQSLRQISFEPQMSRAEYIRLVRRAQDYIAAGDIYQVNLSYPWLAPWPRGLEPLAFYERLRAASPGAALGLSRSRRDAGLQRVARVLPADERPAHRHATHQGHAAARRIARRGPGAGGRAAEVHRRNARNWS